MSDLKMMEMFIGFLFLIFGAIAGEVFGLVGALLLMCSFGTSKKRVHRPRKA